MAYARKEGINITIIKITADIISRFQKTKLQEKGTSIISIISFNRQVRWIIINIILSYNMLTLPY
jgi:hypothetical protein